MSPTADGFVSRHVGPDAPAVTTMLGALGYESLDALVAAAVPASIRTDRPLALPGARTEPEVAAALRGIAEQNTPRVPMIGMGYHGTHTPAVIRRNVLESPAWYTSYTPYQAEISQGRLEALLNFQTVVIDLTGLPVAGSSLLDEATAVAESVALMWRGTKATAGTVVLDSELLPQSIAVATGRAAAIGLPVLVADLSDGLPELDGPLVGVVLQQVATSGTIRDLRPVIEAAHAARALVTLVVDPLAATLLVSAGELGADVAVGSAQRLGVPLFGGGPHAAFIAVAAGLERTMPGRLVGVSKDADGAVAYRLALQTREQHIRREKATSNICTAQALLAIVASMYAVYHGPDGLRAIAEGVRAAAGTLVAGLQQAPFAAAGVVVETGEFFDTVRWVVPGAAAEIVAAAAARGIDIWQVDDSRVQASTSEVTTPEHVAALLDAVAAVVLAAGGTASDRLSAEIVVEAAAAPLPELPATLRRSGEILTHPVFHRYRSETALMRYLRLLSDKDLALDRTMIPLGSCTMKLNAAVEMEPISLPQFADVHPYAPADTVGGYEHLVTELQGWLAEITGYAAVSVQPNAGSQGELAGLLAVRGYLADQRQIAIAAGADPASLPVRDVCLIPASAHGTNAASAAMAGLRVVVVATGDDGAIDTENLRARLAEHGDRVAVLMLTYPSTHGVYEEGVREVADLVHAAGGQVYVDGANLNALVGLARPGEFGGDVSHLNLHKTFCIPHGGGGPGVGPVAVAAHLAPYLPGDPTPVSGAAAAAGSAVGATTPAAPVSGARFGSAGILPISWAYIALMGPDGLRRASEVAVLSANYLAARLNEHYPVLFTGPGGLVAHECILDLRGITKETGVTAEDVAKRLMDYGFHAPTLAFPVPGTLMVEPTESEDLHELDRFVEAMIAIRGEIAAVADGTWPLADSPLRNAPHTAASLVADEWTHPYTREQAAYGVPSLRAGKYWPAVRRIDGAFGDRNLVCACPPVTAYATPDTASATSATTQETTR